MTNLELNLWDPQAFAVDTLMGAFLSAVVRERLVPSRFGQSLLRFPGPTIHVSGALGRS